MVAIQVGVLGPVTVAVGGRRIRLAGKLERAVVSALVLGVGHVVSIDQIEGALWEDSVPPTSHATIQSVVSRLRSKVDDGFVRADDHGYVMDIPPEAIDAVQFERLLDEAIRSLPSDPTRAGEASRSAIGLWRGDPFGHLRDEPFLALEARRLEELRDVAVEVRIESDLVSGDARRAIPRLENLVEIHPYNERLWYLLVWSLASEGRRTEALRVCGKLRSVLAEVGLEAAQEISTIEDEILSGRLSPVGGRSPG